MASIFNTLNIGYSGLNAAQVGIDTTGHNISNAEVEGYSRQRVVASATMPLNTANGNVGNGTEINDVSRVFDNFIFDKYRTVSSAKEYSDYERQKLEELSTYFPDIDGVGLKNDLAAYYDMWQSLADNPDNDAVKIALSQQAQTLTKNLQQTQTQVLDLQQQINDQLAVDINQVNDLASQLADVNKAIEIAESGDAYMASDLRDKRNLLEKDLSRLIGAEVIEGQIESNIQIDSNFNMMTGSYTLSVNGFNIVDGSSFHPLTVSNEGNEYGFYSVSYERQDGVLIPIEESITGGRIGAALALRGGTINTTSGMPDDGILQQTANDLDALAKGLIESTNNLYAKNSTTKMVSDSLEIGGDIPLKNSGLNVDTGSFDVIIYDIDGNEVSRRSITIDAATSLDGVEGSNSIKGQITDPSIDDNNDNNANNDVDDYLDVIYSSNNQLEIYVNPDMQSEGYTFAIEDTLKNKDFASGTNFAGALGLGGFFEGNSARNISVAKEYRDNPTHISAGYSTSSGDNRLALDMVQQQFESYKFQAGTQEYNTTVYGMYDLTATYVGVSTNNAISNNDSTTAQFNAIEMEYFSVSKVSIDEEMTNLIKYQTSYGAAAKVITTVDQMMQTLLGIKQ
jgi:flagellar hook-associated protein 1 FlgK